MLTGVSLHRDVSTIDDEEMAITIRYPNRYIHKAAKTTQFFSTSDIDVLYNNLAGFIQQAAHSYNFSQKDYSTRFEVLREDGKAISVTVNIYIVEGQDKY
jgi:glycogen debranching enzyme